MKSEEATKCDSPFDGGECVGVPEDVLSFEVIHLLDGEPVVFFTRHSEL